MPSLLTHDGALIDPACPVDWSHPLNQDLILDLTVIPNSGWRGGKLLRDLVRGAGHFPHDATFVASPAWVGGNRPGGCGAMKFLSASSQALQTPALNLGGITKLTVAWWMWVDSFTTNADNLAFESSANFNSNPGAVFCDASPSTPDTGKVAIGPSKGDGISYNTVSIPQPSAAAWHHYVAVMDLGAWATATAANCAVRSFSLDGVAQTLTAQTLIGLAPTDFGNLVWNLMSRNGSSLFLSGRMDGFRIWANRLLSAAEVRQLYVEDRKGNPNRYRWCSTRTFWSTQTVTPATPAWGFEAWYPDVVQSRPAMIPV